MAFNPNPPRAEYQATAGQTNFPFLFKIYFTSDIKVYHTPISTGETVLLTEGIGYSVVINGDDGGTVTLILVVENNDYIVLERELQLTRYVEYQTSGDLLAVTLNADQDYQTYLTSDQNSLKDNSLHLADGTFGVDTELPTPEGNSYLKWNTDANKIEYTLGSSVTVPWGNITGTLSDQTDLQTALDSKMVKNNPVYTGTLNGNSIVVDYIASDTVIANNTLTMQDNWLWEAGSGEGLDLTNTLNSNTIISVTASAQQFVIGDGFLGYDGRYVAFQDSYATDTTGGTIKILVSGTDCYITTDGSTPGP